MLENPGNTGYEVSGKFRTSKKLRDIQVHSGRKCQELERSRRKTALGK